MIRLHLVNFACDCVESFGYTGPLCNECGPGKGRDVDGSCKECEQPQINNVTSHSAPCADQECPDGFGVSSDNWDTIGDNCEECPIGEESIAGSGVCVDTTECDPDPCQNGATCTETSDGSTLTPGVYHCECPTGFSGQNCDVQLDRCDPSPCQNGATCSENLTEYTCECMAGF